MQLAGVFGWRQGEAARWRGESTGAGCAGGPARSSGEALAMGAERRGRGVRGFIRLINRGRWPWEESDG